MSVESTTTIAGLNALWPQGTDVKAEGDDHLRLIKSVLKAEFPTGSAGTVAATAQARNRIVNGAMQVSQETGNTAGTTTAYYAADQWAHIAAGSGVYAYSTQRVQSVTSNGSVNRFRQTVTTGAGTGSTTNVSIQQAIEGIRVADFQWGTAAAKQVVLRFGFKGPAGTYGVALRNGATNRTYVGQFTIAANVDTMQTVVIPGDTGGTWASDTGVGLYLNIVLAVGSSFTTSVNTWVNGNFFGAAGQTNGMASAGAVFELFDVGLYLDPTNTGKAPPWQMPDEAQELAACQRYYNKYNGGLIVSGYGAAGQQIFYTLGFPVVMRMAPAIAYSSISYSNASSLATGTVQSASMYSVTTITAAGAGYAVHSMATNARM